MSPIRKETIRIDQLPMDESPFSRSAIRVQGDEQDPGIWEQIKVYLTKGARRSASIQTRNSGMEHIVDVAVDEKGQIILDKPFEYRGRYGQIIRSSISKRGVWRKVG